MCIRDSFNVESIPELEIINELAEKQNKIAQVCFRINPDVGAHTHANITTGLAENKFGIAMRDMEAVIEEAAKMKNIQFLGLHFHIGSPVSYTHLDVYKRQSPLGTPTVQKSQIDTGMLNRIMPKEINKVAQPQDCLLYTSRCV